jgi:multidrug resistance efflux pump
LRSASVRAKQASLAVAKRPRTFGVTANFREVQTRHLRTGQPVDT